MTDTNLPPNRASETQICSPGKIEAFLARVLELQQSLSAEEQENSPAEVERRNFAQEEKIRTVDSHANLLLSSATDNLAALVQLVRTRSHQYAPYVVGRAALEATGLLSHLLASESSTLERVGRSLALRFNTVEEQRKLADALGDSTLATNCVARLEKIAADAESLSLPVRRKEERLTLVGSAMPQKTHLVGAATDNPGIYRILSGVAHGDMTTLRQIGFEEVREVSRGGLLSVPVVRHESQEELLRTVTIAYAQAAWLSLIRSGVARERCQETFEAAFDQLGLSESVRFWRH